MPEQFLHGVEVVEIDTGTRPIRTVRSSVIGLVGTAPDADADKWPLNTPVLVAGKRSDAAGLGVAGTLAPAIDDIFDQAGAVVVVIRVAEGADEAETLSNIIGGTDDVTGAPEGLQVLLAAESVVKVAPRLIVVPEFSQEQAVVSELISIATKLRAIIIADGPNSTDADAITYRENFGSDRIYLVDPWVKVWDTETSTEIVRPASARVAGVIAKSDAERGFWHSPSNRLIDGITGTARAIDFTLGDATSRANILNENEVTTIIQRDGYRLWGNRGLSADPKWAMIKRRRVADMINESIMQAHFWAVDRNADRTYFEDVIEGVNAYGRRMITVGALVGFKCWADPDLNTPEALEAGKVYFDYDWVETPTAEHITFRSMINNGYLSEVLPTA
ncbi:phage tail sheath subtilisin-like domain-containing protein [Phaeobacter piscinae]|uniref:phage tail sheath subtilisin-like domain-containing protein n=1 Tax=Phaeobacter piscinae TaxID=1580596 RepID=UPI00058AE249|nr:phage tail sheath subtilisin-like domain-containing protein [Phaeobacter piscinae]UTS79572.1 Putative prophage major tail sheath protein [Phaeobacter piscinae]